MQIFIGQAQQALPVFFLTWLVECFKKTEFQIEQLML